MKQIPKFPTEIHKTGEPSELSKNILNNILLEMELPNCFGIYGNWGSGKTTIFYGIKNLLEGSEDIKCIIFEAWKYEYAKEGDLMYALIQNIKKEFGIKSGRRWGKKIIVCFLVAFSWLLRKIKVPIDVTEVVNDFKIWEEKMYSEEENWVDKIEEFKKIFTLVIKKQLETKKIKKLIILVDDLDRCLPENSVKLIESIKNFLSVEKTLFVFAIDQRVISQMVEKKYQIFEGYGSEYLLKIIPYYYEIPTLDLTEEVNNILGIHGIKIPEREIVYIINFLRDFVREARIVKNYIHQLGIIINLSNKVKTWCIDEESGTYYMTVAIYLLNKFPQYFSVSKNERNKMINGLGTEVRSRERRKDFAENKMEDVDEKHREKLHSVIKSRKDSQYQSHLSPETLVKAMSLLKDVD